MMSNKNRLWFRIFSLLLICTMVMGCFAGCDENTSRDDDDDRDSADELRDDLDRYEWNGLEFYLDDDMEEIVSRDYRAYYQNEDETLRVLVSGFWVEKLDDSISSAKELREAYLDEFDDEDLKILKQGKENGTYYALAEDDDTSGALGFYYKGGYGWVITALYKDEDLKNTAIDYATLGEIDEVPEKPNQNVTQTPDAPRPEVPDVEIPVEPSFEEITLSIWTGDMDQGEGSWLENRLEAFEEAHPEYRITWEIGVCGDGDVGTVMGADSSAGADVYFFANDQLGTLYEVGALMRLGGDYLEQVQNDNSSVYLDTVTYVDGGVYGFPMTCNTWFMYYNKDVYTPEDIKTMDGLLANGTVSMQMRTPWYTVCFFAANGCTLFGPNGNDASAGIQFGGEAGYEAAEAMVKLANHPNFVDDVSGSAIAGMKDGTVHAMFSGSWDYSVLYEGMGDKLGCAPLPTITIGGQQKQLKAFAGSKAVGVNPHCNNPKVAMQLAAFLASEQSQLLRFEMRGVTPAHRNLAFNATVTASEVAVAEMAVMENCSIAQPYIPEMTVYWSLMDTFGGAIMLGDITLDNYKDMVDVLDTLLNSEGR